MSKNTKLQMQSMPSREVDYAEYLRFVDNAKRNETAEEFLGEYGYPLYCPYGGQTLIAWARIIFAVAHNDWRELVNVAGENFGKLNAASKFARYFEIPYKSLRCWIDNTHKPPTYIIQLVGHALISELPTEENTV